MKNDYRVGRCDTCNVRSENLMWGTDFPDRHCRECYDKLGVCDQCIEPCPDLIARISEWNPNVTNRYCRQCLDQIEEDNKLREAGCLVSRSGKHESYMRQWWAACRTNEVRARMTPEVIERVERDIARVILSESRSAG